MLSVTARFLFGFATVAPAVLANSWVHSNNFSNHDYIAKQAAPDWHFDIEEGCYPATAIWNGQKTPAGSEYVDANGVTRYSGCGGDDPGTDHANMFPTYYRVRYCDYGGDHQEYHVMYSVFFPYSTNYWLGHEYDWEWTVVKWQRAPGQRDQWQRKSIVLAAHGKTSEWNWADYPRTNSASDRQNWRRNADNPIIKFSHDGHGLEANTDYIYKWYWASDWTANGAGFPAMDWGKADSPPNTFEDGGTRDLCWKM